MLQRLVLEGCTHTIVASALISRGLTIILSVTDLFKVQMGGGNGPIFRIRINFITFNFTILNLCYP